jgi:hypothetical protein
MRGDVSPLVIQCLNPLMLIDTQGQLIFYLATLNSGQCGYRAHQGKNNNVVVSPLPIIT